MSELPDLARSEIVRTRRGGRTRRLTVLSIGYSLARVGPDEAGGSEQILSHLDAALVRAGHRSIVVAPTGSVVAGELVATGPLPDHMDDQARGEAQGRSSAALEATLANERVDLIHMHGLDWPFYVPTPGVPLLATLHLPPSWYARSAFDPGRPDTWLNCVSASQLARCPPSAIMLGAIENGVPVERLAGRFAKRGFVLGLGRICPEKGFDIALDAATRAGVPMILAGEVFPYPDHLAYFAEEIVPRLGRRHRFVGPVGFARKRRLLSAARALLVPSLAEETSSLVSMEALACGTPVIALPNGALPDIVEPGVTGYLVPDAAAMAEAIGAAGALDPQLCRAVAATRFSVERMTADYLRLYGQLALRQRDQVTAAAGGA